jgi:drug/metabolite transporter (DMT)-like permease
MKPDRHGLALCVLSAVGFGAMAIFAKEAYGAGVNVVTLLSLRFLLAAALFWVIVIARGTPLPPRRVLLTGLALGGGGFAAQGCLYFGALTRIDASLTSLLTYLYPALVFLGALAIGRERVSGPRAGALVLATAGTVLVLLGGGIGALDGPGVAMALACAVVYAGYILVADRAVAQVEPFLLGALVMTGAAASVTAVGVGGGGLHLGFGAAGYGWIGALAIGSTVVGVSAFLVGLRAVGPASASIVSTVEPAVTVGLATTIYGETLGAGQLAGGLLVLSAVVVLQLRSGTVSGDEPADRTARPAPARTLAHEPA